MTSHNRPRLRATAALAATVALGLLASLFPATAAAVNTVPQSYVVVLKGGYALDGSYALGKGYALVGQNSDYALDGTYALGEQYALYALNRTYALLDDYALTDQYALDDNYRQFGEYALTSGYALDTGYALGEGYALASQTATDVVDASYALADDAAGYALGEQYALLDAYALGKNYALARDYALYIISVSGGVVTADLSSQIGVMIVESKNSTFAQTLKSYALVEEVGNDFSEKRFPSKQEALNNGQLTVVAGDTSAPPGLDPLEDQQWSMAMIRSRQANADQMGRKLVRVGVVDSGVDGNHVDFKVNGISNIDCQHGADFTADGPGVGNPLACVDNNFHGTHVAGIIAARRNGVGVAGIAPNVTIVPIKVCDADGHCYVSDSVQGITYAGDLRLNAINMSFFVDDAEFQQSTEFKCQSDRTQRAYITSVERALKYARGQGVSLIAALGNSDVNMANPPGGNGCKSVPAMSAGVTGTVALGPDREKASYSSWGNGYADVSAPGGNGTTGNCLDTVLSTIPGGWGCFQGTSMASPHTTGVAALIISEYGKKNANGRWVMAPDKVWTKLRATVIDMGAKGYDKCFGYGRIDALRAVRNNTSYQYDSTAPKCTEPN